MFLLIHSDDVKIQFEWTKLDEAEKANISIT